MIIFDKNFEAANGKFYGYPDCCIEEYLSRQANGISWQLLEEKFPKAFALLGRKGFIPCEKHLTLIEAGNIIPQELISGRIDPSPYPDDTISSISREEFLKAERIIEEKVNKFISEYREPFFKRIG
mgnify:CR=1 FL=1